MHGETSGRDMLELFSQLDDMGIETLCAERGGEEKEWNIRQQLEMVES